MSPEAYASYASWLFFTWFNYIIKIGSTKTLNSSDLPELLPILRARTVWSQFQAFSSNIRYARAHNLPCQKEKGTHLSVSN